jgi:hypothetical protein
MRNLICMCTKKKMVTSSISSKFFSTISEKKALVSVQPLTQVKTVIVHMDNHNRTTSSFLNAVDFTAF